MGTNVPFTDRNSEQNSPICPIVQPSVPHIYHILLIQSLFADATKKNRNSISYMPNTDAANSFTDSLS